MPQDRVLTVPLTGERGVDSPMPHGGLTAKYVPHPDGRHGRLAPPLRTAVAGLALQSGVCPYA